MLAANCYQSANRVYPPAVLGTSGLALYEELNNPASKTYWRHSPYTSWCFFLSQFQETVVWPNAPLQASDFNGYFRRGEDSIWMYPGFVEASSTKLADAFCPSSTLSESTEEVYVAGAVQPVYGPNPNDIPYGVDFRNLRTLVEGDHVGTNYIASVGLSSDDDIDAFQAFSGFLAVRNRRKPSEIVAGLSKAVAFGETIGGYSANRRRRIQSFLLGGIGVGKIFNEQVVFGDMDSSNVVMFGSNHDAVNFAFGDNHVEAISRGIDPVVALHAFRCSR